MFIAFESGSSEPCKLSSWEEVTFEFPDAPAQDTGQAVSFLDGDVQVTVERDEDQINTEETTLPFGLILKDETAYSGTK